MRCSMEARSRPGGESSSLLRRQEDIDPTICSSVHQKHGSRWRSSPQQLRTALVLVSIILSAIAYFGGRSGPYVDHDVKGNLDPAPGSVLAAAGTRSDYLEGYMVLLDKDSKRKKKNREIKTEGGEEEKAPNVIFILIDDVGMNDIGLHSTDLWPFTPFIDSLIEGGVHLANYYTNHFCTPARASLMSGRDTFRTGMQYEELQNAHPWGLPLDEATLADRFKAAGYATHMVGKWNLGMFTEDHYPFNRGFDTFLGYLGAEETYYSHSNEVWKDFGFGDSGGYINYATNTTRWGPELEGVYSTSLTAERAIQVASKHQASNAETPLFLYLAFQAAHFPLDSPPAGTFSPEQRRKLNLISSEPHKRVVFAEIIYFLDITLQKMIGQLDEIGMMDNTLLVLASDNGGCATFGGSNYPFRGFKTTLFEGGVRTPALVYSKSENIIPLDARGTTYSGMMHVTDWTPTLANITSIPTVGMGKPLSGFDQWSAIIGKRPQFAPAIRNELVLGYNSYVYDSSSDRMVKFTKPKGAYIYDGWKINVGDRCTGWFSFNPNDDLSFDTQCKGGNCPTCDNGCIYEPSHNHSFMFHLDKDPYEKVNLIEEMPEKFEDMVQRWTEACEDEVMALYQSSDLDSMTKWEEYNDWVVSWL